MGHPVSLNISCTMSYAILLGVPKKILVMMVSLRRNLLKHPDTVYYNIKHSKQV